MGLSGGAGLDRAIARLRQLADRSTFRKIAHEVGAEMLHLVDTGFQGGKDPSGASWLELKLRRGQPLLDTGRLRNSFHYLAVGSTVEVGTDVSYAKYHQNGTSGHGAYSRNQPVNKRGKFMSKAKASKRKAGAVAFRDLQFQEGGGKIPARKMLPEDRLPAKWQRGIAQVIVNELDRLLRGAA